MRPSAPGSPAWQRLQELADAGVGRDLPGLFNSDRERESRYTRSAAGLRFDFSRQRITDDVLNELTALSEVIELPIRIAEMWRGDRINTTEDRAVLHVALRQDAGDVIGGAAIETEVLAERERLLKFADLVREGAVFDHVINIGIGGSDLGPKFFVAALASGVRRSTPKIHFVSNVDGCSLVALLERVDPRRTLFIVCSKTFTTQETMSNATLARDWLVSSPCR
jgi:glucose-6-phosphate isomerase